MSTPKLSFTTLGCPDWTLDDIAKHAKAYGYDGVELRTAPDGNHISPDAPRAEAERVGKKLRDAGAPVMSVMGYCRFAFTDPKEVAENQALMRKLIPLAQALGAPYIRTFGGQFPKGADRAAITRTVGEALKPLAVEAAAAGVKIGMETHDDWCSGDLVMQVVRMVNSSAFGMVYDIHNAFHSGIEPWDVTYAKVKDHILYCHLKDGYRDAGGALHYVMLGAGELPVQDILARFKRDGFSSYFSLEWEKKWHAELDAPERAFPQFPIKLRRLW
ncbi:MAG: sugar phosphate isomerase/epimerase family protein, partial [bacterium]